MMGSEEDAPAKAAPGLGLGGGSDARTNGGRMAELEAALRRETVEASMDNAGDNVQTEARRKTERGQAGVTYSHSGAGARSTAAVPSLRRRCRKAGAPQSRHTSSANNDDHPPPSSSPSISSATASSASPRKSGAGSSATRRS